MGRDAAPGGGEASAVRRRRAGRDCPAEREQVEEPVPDILEASTRRDGSLERDRLEEPGLVRQAKLPDRELGWAERLRPPGDERTHAREREPAIAAVLLGVPVAIQDARVVLVAPQGRRRVRVCVDQAGKGLHLSRRRRERRERERDGGLRTRHARGPRVL